MTEYPMFKVHMDVEAALAELRTVLESGFVNEGVQVSALQRAVAEFLGVKQLVLTNSCTSALTLALKLCGVAPGSEVVTTPMTCVATNTPIDNLGGTVVWADIDPETASIDAGDVERRRGTQISPDAAPLAVAVMRSMLSSSVMRKRVMSGWVTVKLRLCSACQRNRGMIDPRESSTLPYRTPTNRGRSKARHWLVTSRSATALHIP